MGAEGPSFRGGIEWLGQGWLGLGVGVRVALRVGVQLLGQVAFDYRARELFLHF